MNVAADVIGMEVLAVGNTDMLCRPCVDCGRYTGRFCDNCFAQDRIPSEVWANGHGTPLRSQCDWRWDEMSILQTRALLHTVCTWHEGYAVNSSTQPSPASRTEERKVCMIAIRATCW